MKFYDDIKPLYLEPGASGVGLVQHFWRHGKVQHARKTQAGTYS